MLLTCVCVFNIIFYYTSPSKHNSHTNNKILLKIPVHEQRLDFIFGREVCEKEERMKKNIPEILLFVWLCYISLQLYLFITQQYYVLFSISHTYVWEVCVACVNESELSRIVTEIEQNRKKYIYISK